MLSKLKEEILRKEIFNLQLGVSKNVKEMLIRLSLIGDNRAVLKIGAMLFQLERKDD